MSTRAIPNIVVFGMLGYAWLSPRLQAQGGMFYPPPGGSGTVTTFSVSCLPWITCPIATPTTTPSLTIGAATGQTSHQVIGTCGSATSFAPCSLEAGDLPLIPNSGLVNSAITIAGTSVSLGGSTSSFPSPGAIGGTTPAAGTFTTLTVNTSLATGGAASVCNSLSGCIGLINGSSAMTATSGQCGLRGDAITSRILYNCNSTSDTLLIGTGDNAQLATLGLGAAPTTTSPLHIATAIAGSPAAGDLGPTSTSAGEYTQLQSYDGTYTHTYTAETHKIGPSTQTGAVSQTTIVSPGVATTYRVCYALDSATSSGSGTIQLTVSATDNGLITRTSAAVSLTANTNGDSACWVFKLASSAALKYSTAYGGSGSGNYNLEIVVEPI